MEINYEIILEDGTIVNMSTDDIEEAELEGLNEDEKEEFIRNCIRTNIMETMEIEVLDY